VLGKTEDLVIVLVIVLVLFGAKKLPELAKGIGESVKEVRKGFKDDPNETTNTSNSNSQNKA